MGTLFTVCTGVVHVKLMGNNSNFSFDICTLCKLMQSVQSVKMKLMWKLTDLFNIVLCVIILEFAGSKTYWTGAKKHMNKFTR